MENILIIKTGATGDVIRTTPLLKVLDGNIYWVTAEENRVVLPVDEKLQIVSLEDAFQTLKGISFSQIISLEEDETCARLARPMNSKELTGIYLENDSINYTDSSAHWFDMSRVSKLGLARANELKRANTHTYQEHVFEMTGRDFKGEPYQIFKSAIQAEKNGTIGIEKRSGHRWPDKEWWGYDQLVQKLEATGAFVKVFEQKDDIRAYFMDIDGCDYIVSGDTLAMHVALAYGKSCTAIFNCTSPQEIFDYGLLKKMVSPVLGKYFYSTSFDKEATEAISLQDVYETLPV